MPAPINCTGGITASFTPIIDCAGSKGTAGQILSSTGTAIQWTTAGGSAATPTVAGIVLGCTATFLSTAIGCNALRSNAGCCNAAFGYNALCANTTGTGNAAFGYNALCVNTTGATNTAVGSGAMQLNSGGTGNTAVGSNSLLNNNNGRANVSVGGASMLCNTTGGYNTAIGLGSLQTNLIGCYNTAVGNRAAQNSKGYHNTVVGYFSLYCATTGSYNTVLGTGAAFCATTGSCNVAIGSNVSLPVNTGDCQLAIGFGGGCCWLTGCSTRSIRPAAGIMDCTGSTGTASQVLTSNGANAICWATFNGSPATPTVAGTVLGCTTCLITAVGCCALAFGCGSGSTAMGSFALSRACNTTGNTAIGGGALQYNTFGTDNTAVGCASMLCNTTGCFNAALGACTGIQLGNAAYNTMVGWRAFAAGTGSRNTLLGARSGMFITGACNIVMGVNAVPSANAVNSEVTIFNGTNLARFQGAATAWTFVSDARDKKNIENLPLGLEFIESLQPRKFEWNHRDTEVEHNKPAAGFIAQEVLEAVEASDAYYANLVDTNNPEQYTLAQANLVPILVNAVKELSKQVKELQLYNAQNPK